MNPQQLADSYILLDEQLVHYERAVARNDWEAALQHTERAIELCPQPTILRYLGSLRHDCVQRLPKSMWEKLGLASAKRPKGAKASEAVKFSA